MRCRGTPCFSCPQKANVKCVRRLCRVAPPPRTGGLLSCTCIPGSRFIKRLRYAARRARARGSPIVCMAIIITIYLAHGCSSQPHSRGSSQVPARPEDHARANVRRRARSDHSARSSHSLSALDCTNRVTNRARRSYACHHTTQSHAERLERWRPPSRHATSLLKLHGRWPEPSGAPP